MNPIELSRNAMGVKLLRLKMGLRHMKLCCDEDHKVA